MSKVLLFFTSFCISTPLKLPWVFKSVICSFLFFFLQQCLLLLIMVMMRMMLLFPDKSEDTYLDVISGRISIFNILISSSPGKAK